MVDIIDEVLQDQSEIKKVFYFKYLLIITLIVIFVLGLGLYLYDSYKEQQILHNTEIGAELVNAIMNYDQNEDNVVEKLDKLIEEDESRIKEFALLKKVDIKISNRDYAGAKTLLEDMISNNYLYDLTNAYARIIWIGLVLDEKIINDQDIAKLQEYFNYFASVDQVFFGVANLLKATWYIKNNKTNEAQQVLRNIISMNNLPQITIEHARTLLSNLE